MRMRSKKQTKQTKQTKPTTTKSGPHDLHIHPNSQSTKDEEEMKNSLVTKITIAGVLITGGAAFAANATAKNSVDPAVSVESTDNAVTPFLIVDKFDLDESNVEDIELAEDNSDESDLANLEADDADDSEVDADDADDDSEVNNDDQADESEVDDD